ncbi:MAG: ATP-binding protein [Thermomicrobiales bacterium]|nr:ATP-binding protein [Thermomicrobiales bacterium]
MTTGDVVIDIDMSAFRAESPLDQPIATFASMIDQRHGVIGRVVSSEKEPAGSNVFYFWAGEDQLSLDIGHIVVGFSEEAAVIGVVDEPRRFSDLRSFLDDFFDRHLEEALDAEPPTRRPEILVFEVHVLRTRHLRQDVVSQRPVVSGPVYFATRQAIDYALGVEEFSGVPIPALLHTNGNAAIDEQGDVVIDERGNTAFQRSPLWLDEEYLLGPEAGHANWTGQSGLATKTSHALFLTSAVFQRMAEHGKSVAALLFNVKGPDLVWLDKSAVPPPELTGAYRKAGFSGLEESDFRAYASIGLEIEPFENLRIFAPFKPGQQPGGGHQSVVNLGSEKYHDRLNTLRTAIGERDRVYPILWSLEPLLYMPHKVFDRGDLDDKMWGLIAEFRDRQGITSLNALSDRIREVLAQLDDSGGSEWQGHHKATILKALNRFNGLTSKFNGLLTDGNVDYGNLPRADSSFTNQEVRVIDIANCNSNVQELLVTSIIDRVWKMAEEQNLGVDKLIVFVDELNKYAPNGGEGSLRNTLVDIAARGRHLNVVLFGAQQFRSKVDAEILGNCGTSFYGRVGDEEIINASYRSLSETTKAELLGLPKGRLLVRHAHFRAPLFGAFPRPPVIPGMAGQRVFNGEQDIPVTISNPADALYRLAKRFPANDTPTQGEVRTLADGLSAESIERICAQTEQRMRSVEGTSAATRVTAWSMIQHGIRQARDAERFRR